MTVLSALIALVSFIPVVLLIHEVYEQMQYRAKTLRRGTGMPYLYRFYPLGITSILTLKRAQEKHELMKLFNDIFAAIGKRTFRAQAVGDFPVVTVDPQNLKAIMATQFKDFDLGDRNAQLKCLLGQGIFVADGFIWKHSRAMLRPQFTREQVSRLHSIEEHTQKLLQFLYFRSRYEGVFNAQQLFHDFTLDTATEFLFGESVGCLSGREKLCTSEFSDAFRVCQEMLVRRAQLGKLYWLYDSPKFRRNIAVCHKFVDYFVDKALAVTPEEKEKSKRYIFLNALTEETRDPVMLRDQSINVLLAGRDTTANVLCFAIWHLTRHKYVWRQLREEVLEKFGYSTAHISFETLKQCGYLKQVINEVLRLHPPAPFLFRQAQYETTLPRGGGTHETDPIFIKKGGIVYYSLYSLHRDPEFWGSDAEDFRPDRWNQIPHADLPWRFIPFGGGPRLCLGQQFSLTEISYVLVRMMQTFTDVYSTPEKLAEPLLQKMTLSLQVQNGVHCAFSLDDKSGFIPDCYPTSPYS